MKGSYFMAGLDYKRWKNFKVSTCLHLGTGFLAQTGINSVSLQFNPKWKFNKNLSLTGAFNFPQVFQANEATLEYKHDDNWRASVTWDSQTPGACDFGITYRA